MKFSHIFEVGLAIFAIFAGLDIAQIVMARVKPAGSTS